MRARCLVAVLLAVCLAGCAGGVPAPAPRDGQPGGHGETVTVYSARHYEIDAKLFDAFTKQTGIAVDEIKGTADELLARLQQEGENTPADLFVSVDGGILDYAKRQGALQPLGSESVRLNVPAQWRDPDDYWTGITMRARVIVYSLERVDRGQLSTYEDLADDRWKGRVLVRSSANLYNQSLLASFIELYGTERAEVWAEGIVRNLARMPEGGDRSQALAIGNGIGDIAIMNTYYVGQLMASINEDEAEIAHNLGVFFPNQSTSGTHVNVSGVGLVKHASNRAAALKLIEYMTGKEGQSLLAAKSYEFPVNEAADLPELLHEWNGFKRQQIAYSAMSARNEEATEIFSKVGWD